MADNYAQFSEEIVVPGDKVQAVIEFLQGYEKMCQAEEVDWYGGVHFGFPIKEGDKTFFWFLCDEDYTDEELIYIVQGVLMAAELTEPVTVSIAYTCSKPRVGEFGGGCYVIWQDNDYYVDATQAAMNYIKSHADE